jgi:flavorubredoxin
MSDVIIIYDSKTGNTEKAAGYVLEGAKSAGASVELKKVNKATPGDIAGAKGVIFGSYCMRDKCSSDLVTFIGSLPPTNKPGAAFGSYGFSGGQLQKLEDLMKNAGIGLVAPGVNALKAPDEQAAVRLRELGKKVAEAVKQ